MRKNKNKKKKSSYKKKAEIVDTIGYGVDRLKDIQRKFGLENNSTEIVDNLDILRYSKPNIVISQCLHDNYFQQNNSATQKLERKKNYVMSISIYNSLEYDTHTITKNGSIQRNLKPAKISFHDIYKPYQGQNLSNKKLLVMRTGGIGDLLFIQPNLIYLKNKYPNCKIVFATALQYHPMVKEWDCIDKVISLPFVDKELISSQYHLIFEGVIERTKEAHYTNSYELFSKWMGLNLDKEMLRPQQNSVQSIFSEVQEILKNSFNISGNDKICAVQIKASSPIRTPHPQQLWLPILKFLISRDYKIVITDNPLLHDQIENIINQWFFEIKNNIYNFTKYSKDISYAIALADIADMVIGPDSSMVHIAESVKTKNFGIYGPFPGKIRLSTYKYNDWVDCKSNCSPCFTHGHRPCLYGGQNGGCSPCYQNINMSEFIEKFKELELRYEV